MIQRKQTIFYLIAAICAGAVFFLPLATSDKPAGLFMDDKVFNVFDHIGITIVAALAALLPLVAIFLFKNRSTQLKVGYSSLIFPLLVMIAGVLIAAGLGKDANVAANISPKMGFPLALAGLMFTILANINVKKDDELVKSSDRLR